MKKIVTLSIPIYNISKELIKECLDSVVSIMKETNSIEAFVIENASTDESIWPWLNENYGEYKDINLVKFDQNNGKPPTTKYSIDNANGKWLIILDSDDLLEKNEFMKILPVLEEYESNAIFTDYSYLNDKNKKIRRRYMHPTNKYVSEMKRMYAHMWHFDHSIIHNINFLRENNFDYPENITSFEDIYNNMFVLSKANKLLYVKSNFYMYRIKQKGKNMTSSIKMMEKNHEFEAMLIEISKLSYENKMTKYHMVWFFSLQMVSVIFFYDMKNNNWFPFKTRRRLKKMIKENNEYLWKMLSSKNIYHWTLIGLIAVLASPFWKLGQIIVKKFRP